MKNVYVQISSDGDSTVWIHRVVNQNCDVCKWTRQNLSIHETSKLFVAAKGAEPRLLLSKARMGAPDLSAHKGQHLVVLYLNKASN